MTAPRAGESAGAEQRAHPRKDLELPVTVSDTASRVAGTLCFDTLDLSAGGAFLRSDLLFELGEELELQLALPGGALVTLRGKVVRVVRDVEREGGTVAGMGIAFTAFSDEDRDAVRAFLARP